MYSTEAKIERALCARKNSYSSLFQNSKYFSPSLSRTPCTFIFVRRRGAPFHLPCSCEPVRPCTSGARLSVSGPVPYLSVLWTTVTAWSCDHRTFLIAVRTFVRQLCVVARHRDSATPSTLHLVFYFFPQCPAVRVSSPPRVWPCCTCGL